LGAAGEFEDYSQAQAMHLVGKLRDFFLEEFDALPESRLAEMRKISEVAMRYAAGESIPSIADDMYRGAPRRVHFDIGTMTSRIFRRNQDGYGGNLLQALTEEPLERNDFDPSRIEKPQPTTFGLVAPKSSIVTTAAPKRETTDSCVVSASKKQVQTTTQRITPPTLEAPQPLTSHQLILAKAILYLCNDNGKFDVRGAKCITDPEAMYVEGAAQNKAKMICMACPIIATCLADALLSEYAEGYSYGVRGGMTARQRRKFLKMTREPKAFAEEILSGRLSATSDTSKAIDGQLKSTSHMFRA